MHTLFHNVHIYILMYKFDKKLPYISYIPRDLYRMAK